MFGIRTRLRIPQPENDGPRGLQSLPSTGFPVRLQVPDTLAWREPVPPASGNYQTFWQGNQLPGSYMHVTPHAAWIHVSSQDDLQPQYRGGAFGQVMGQLQTAQLIANWRTALSGALSKYGQ